MNTSVYGTIQTPPYWNGWALSACMHTVMVGVVLFLSQQLPVPKKAERDPIAVAFVTPQPTHTVPTHRPTIKKSPPTPTATPKQVQTEAIPREPTQSKPHTQTQHRKPVSPQTVVQASPKPAPLPKVHVTNTTPVSVAQPKTVRQTQTTHQPTVRHGVPSSQPVSQPVSHTPTAQPAAVAQRTSQPAISSGVIASQPIPRHTDITRQRAAPKVQASPSHKKPIHVEAKTNKVDPVTPQDPVIHNHVTTAPRPLATPVRSAPLRQSVNTLPSHVEKRVQAPTIEAMKQPVTRRQPHTAPGHVFENVRAQMKQPVTRGQPHTAAKHVFSRPAQQQASLASVSPVVQTRTTVNYTRQQRKARPTTISKSVSGDGLSPELLAFSKLLREKIARTLEFPRLAKRLGYSGTTHVALALSKTGVVRNLKVSQPSGYEILDKAAIVTLKKVLQTTKPPESIEIGQLVIPIAFNLKRN